jgi:membrane protein implicated in regulation of membrane protease activity
MRKIFLTIVLLAMAPAAFAYIGPGAGISLVSGILGVLGAIFLGLFAILAWPVRRMLKRRKAAREAAQNPSGDEPHTDSDEPTIDDPQD